jgi:hypothetical protein
VRPRGLTPLEFYGRHLFDEPLIHQSLSLGILEVLKWHERQCNAIREHPEGHSYEEYQKELLTKDAVFLDFFRTKFVYGGKKVDMSVIWEALPLIPSHPYYQGESAKPHRMPVNGVMFEFAMFLIKTRTFELHEELGPFHDEFMPKAPEELAEQLLMFEHFLSDFHQYGALPDFDPGELVEGTLNAGGDD